MDSDFGLYCTQIEKKKKKSKALKDYLWRFLKILGLNLPYVLWSCKVADIRAG